MRRYRLGAVTDLLLHSRGVHDVARDVAPEGEIGSSVFRKGQPLGSPPVRYWMEGGT